MTDLIEPCRACGQRSTHLPSFKGLEKCTACGFLSLRQTSGVKFEDLYGDACFAGEEYADYLGQEEALRLSMRRHLGQMARYRPLGGALLEVGCAYGFFLGEAAKYFRPVTGLDIAANAVRFAQERLGVDARVANFPDFEAERRFEAVCLWDTLAHVPDPVRFVARA